MIVPFLCLALFGILASALPRELLQNDIVALNYALTLENLEAYFYNTYSIYSQSDFNNAGIKAKASYFTLIKAHENAHVAALTETIESLGGVAATPCQYSFTVNNIRDFVAIARLLENTGVSAYDGAINTLANPDLRQAAATIATVEARHAAYLNDITDVPPFPDAFDTAIPPNTIVTAIQPFIVSCPYTIRTPQVVVFQDNAATSVTSIGALLLAATLFLVSF